MNSLSRLTERARHAHNSVNRAFKPECITQSTNLEPLHTVSVFVLIVFSFFFFVLLALSRSL